MRKNTLMICAAVAALTAGSSLAFAQGAQEHRGGAGAGAAEKSAPSGGAAQHTPSQGAQSQGAQRGEQKGGSANQMGQAHEGKSKSETTGQAPSERGNKNEKMGQGADQNKSKAGTTGQAPSEQRATPKSDKLKGEHNANERNERNRSTTGQGAPENRNNMENRNTMENRGGTENRGATENRGGTSTTNRSSTSTSVNLSSEQKTKIHSIIVSERSAPRVEHVDFSVNVGTVVPRGKVKFAPIPASIVEIEPAWRGYEYFLVGNEIVVVDPSTLKIVAVLPA